jgi:hypothetical protein
VGRPGGGRRAGRRRQARLGGVGRPRGREAVEALLWHLCRDPGLGASLPGTEASWFVYKQAGVAEAGVPEVAAVYRFELDELLPVAVRVGPDPEDPEEG